MKNGIIEIEKASIELHGRDLIITRYKGDANISEDDAKEIHTSHLYMSQARNMFILIDKIFGNAKISEKAKDFFIQKGKIIPFIKGVAILSSKRSTFLQRLFDRSTKTFYPIKEFIAFEAAYKWFDKVR